MLTEEQKILLDYLQDNGCDVTAALAVNFVAKETFEVWIKEAAFQKAYNLIVENCNKNVINALYVKSLAGDVEAARLYLQQNTKVYKTDLDPLGLDIMAKIYE
jgi:hypothetical protein